MINVIIDIISIMIIADKPAIKLLLTGSEASNVISIRISVDISGITKPQIALRLELRNERTLQLRFSASPAIGSTITPSTNNIP